MPDIGQHKDGESQPSQPDSGQTDQTDQMDRLRTALARQKAAAKRQHVARCRRDFIAFFQYVMVADGLPADATDCLRQWWAHVSRWLPTHHVGIVSPPNFGKTYFAVALNLWWLGHDPEHRVAWVSGKEQKAKDRLAMVKAYIEESRRLHEVFPALRKSERDGAVWSATAIEVARRGIFHEYSVHAFGFDSAQSGPHFTRIIFDDPIDIRDMTSATEREFHRQQFDMVWQERLTQTPPGRMLLVIMHRWADDDMVSARFDDDRWKILVQGVTDDCEQVEQPPAHLADRGLPVGVVQPDRRTLPLPRWISTRSLLARKRNNRPAWEHQYQQRTRRSTERTFSEEALTKTLRWDIDARDVAQQAVANRWPTYITTDFSGKKRAGNVILVGALRPGGAKAVIDIAIGRWGPGPELAGRIRHYHDLYRSSLIVVEDAALQASFTDWFRAFFPDGRYTIQNLGGTRRKWHPELGLPAIHAEFHRGEWLVPLRHIADRRAALSAHESDPWCRLAYELLRHPDSTDDCIMALWQLQRILAVPGMVAPPTANWAEAFLQQASRPLGPPRRFASPGAEQRLTASGRVTVAGSFGTPLPAGPLPAPPPAAPPPGHMAWPGR